MSELKFDFLPDPSLTEKFPAIDGIATPPGPKEKRECNTSGQMYDYQEPGTEPIRPDVLALLELPEEQAKAKLDAWESAVRRRLEEIKLIAEIPQLSVDITLDDIQKLAGAQRYGTVGSWTVINSEIDILERALTDVQALRARVKTRVRIDENQVR